MQNQASSTMLVCTTTSPYAGNVYASGIPLTQIEVLTQQVQNLQKQMVRIQARKEKKKYTMEDLRAYPYDRSLYMLAFPPHFETPKFDKYKGKGDPRDHIREFFTSCI